MKNLFLTLGLLIIASVLSSISFASVCSVSGIKGGSWSGTYDLTSFRSKHTKYRLCYYLYSPGLAHNSKVHASIFGFATLQRDLRPQGGPSCKKEFYLQFILACENNKLVLYDNTTPGKKLYYEITSKKPTKLTATTRFGLAKYDLTMSSASRFGSHLLNPANCTASNCPSGAYLVSPATSGSELYQFGTLLGGSQDGSVSGITSQWSPNRYAILIESGTYNMTNSANVTMPFRLGYYTEVLGVDASRSNVVINPGINALNDCNSSLNPTPATCLTVGGLNNFWRGLANLTIDPSNLLLPTGSGLATALRFAVSQAAPIRNLQFKAGNLPSGVAVNFLLCDWNTGQTGNYNCGYTSGGFMSNSAFAGNLIAGSQQQFYVSNTTYNEFQAGTWNLVSHNNTGTLSQVSLDPSTTYDAAIPWVGTAPFTSLTNASNPNVNMHKPRLVFNATAQSNQWQVYIGKTDYAAANDFTILNLTKSQSPTVISATAVAKINTALQSSKGLIILPGIYKLKGTINVPENVVVLGIGIPTLECQSTTGACMTTGNAGVRIAGIIFDAGTKAGTNTGTLLTVGTTGGKSKGTKTNPSVLQDVYCRIARTSPTQKTSPSANSCITINANHVIGQNLWLWRADHDAVSSAGHTQEQNSLVTWGKDQAPYGLIVNGDDVVMDGLAVEHFQNYQTVWNGKNGTLRFYQSEMPYILPSGDGGTTLKNSVAKVACSTPGGSVTSYQVCPSLYIGENATGFLGYGLGVYSYFPSSYNSGTGTQKNIYAESAIKVDNASAVLTNVITRWLNGAPKSGIMTLCNII